MTRTCPDHILDLFKQPATRAQGRWLAIKWAEQQVADMRAGDEIWLPHPVTGALECHKFEPEQQA